MSTCVFVDVCVCLREKERTFLFCSEYTVKDWSLCACNMREKQRGKKAFLGMLFLSASTPHPLQESPDRKTYFIKFHASHECLLKGADDLLLRMPIEVWGGGIN